MRRPAEVVLITGASAGVGRATALAFARRGAHIGLLARDRERLEEARREVEMAGGRAVVVPADVSEPEQVEAAAVGTEKAFGPIDIWINNAMTSVFAPVKDTTADEFKRVMDVTFLGYVYGTQAALRRMLPRDSGVIVQVGSALAYRGIPLQAAYCAAKHAIQGFCDSLWAELIHDRSHVRMTMVQLPALNTPQFDWVKSRLARKAQPVPPLHQPEVAAKAIVWAADHPEREVWVGAPVVKAILADRIMPGRADQWLAAKGYETQQTREREHPGRPDNLWKPVPGNYGAHGRFDAVARRSSFQFWLARHKDAVFGTMAIVGAVAVWRRASAQDMHQASQMRAPRSGRRTRSRAR
jgi:short-subunit dehydrogenase